MMRTWCAFQRGAANLTADISYRDHAFLSWFLKGREGTS